jgi:hypothetical protein
MGGIGSITLSGNRRVNNNEIFGNIYNVGVGHMFGTLRLLHCNYGN